MFWQELNYDGYMQRGTAALFLLIAIFLIVGLIGAFSLGLFKSTTLQTPLKVLAPAPKLLTYTNQNLSFEFQYPTSNFIVKEDSEEAFNKRGNGDFRKNFKGYVGYEPGKFVGAMVVLDKNNDFEKNPLTVWVFENPDNLSIDGWYKNYWYYPFLWGVFDYTSKGHVALDQEATISGQTAKYKIVSYQPGSPKFMYVAKDGKMYLFRVIDDAKHTGDQILSSFKFSAEGKPCGGIAGDTNEFVCPGGYECQYPRPMYPDAQGRCVKL